MCSRVDSLFVLYMAGIASGRSEATQRAPSYGVVRSRSYIHQHCYRMNHTGVIHQQQRTASHVPDDLFFAGHYLVDEIVLMALASLGHAHGYCSRFSCTLHGLRWHQCFAQHLHLQIGTLLPPPLRTQERRVGTQHREH